MPLFLLHIGLKIAEIISEWIDKQKQKQNYDHNN
jgi:hypothetical protein